MRILADPNIPQVEAAFSGLGDVSFKPGREWRHADVMKAEILLVRSVTAVDEALLKHTPVLFVGSATAGIDHVDTDYLSRRGIRFRHAPGSNAVSVVEYVISALLALYPEPDELIGKRVGIIGAGQVGRRLARRLEALGLVSLLNDPPRQRKEGNAGFVGLDEALQADIVSLHVPLTLEGEDPTWRLLNAERVRSLRPGTVLVNSARGGVVDEVALMARLEQEGDLRVVIDCWEEEPSIRHQLLERADISTPHIAGYSHDGKLRATRMLYQSVCDFLGAHGESGIAIPEPSPVSPAIGREAGLAAIVHACYDVRVDSRRLKRALNMSFEDASAYFDELRRHYPVRREFSAHDLGHTDFTDELAGKLAGLGFQVRNHE